MDNSKWSVLLQKYELGKLLGQGTFAKVYHGRNIKTGDSVAIKVIDKEKVLKFGMMEQIKREISTMSLVKHPNIVELYEVMATKTKIYLVMEYVKGGELFNKVAKGRLKEEAVRKYFQQLISAVDYCHSRGVCHRDLKPENLLLDDNGNLKVSDFGLSAIADTRRQDGLLHTACGTPAYVAPEVISRKGYDGAKADVWSCGVILYVLYAGYLPFRDPNLMEMYKKITKADFKYPNWFSYELRKLISKILDPNPKTRISVAKIIENPWFRKGFTRKSTREVTRAVQLVSDETLCEPGNNIREEKELAKVTSLNAFDIISLASGLDLSGLLVDTTECKIESRFTSTQTASTIFSKFEEIAKKTKLMVVKKDGGMMKLERSKEGRMGRVSIDVEISQIALNLYLVEVRKSNGDTLEYQQLWKKDIRPALEDIVWAWQGQKNDDILEESQRTAAAAPVTLA